MLNALSQAATDLDETGAERGAAAAPLIDLVIITAVTSGLGGGGGFFSELAQTIRLMTAVHTGRLSVSGAFRMAFGLADWGDVGTGTRFAPNRTVVQGAKGRSPWTADLSHVTGKTAQSRNRAIDAIIREDLPNLKLTQHPQYSPFASQGVAKRGVGTQIGKQPFQSRQALRDTIIHEELHHRWWRRGKDGWHHSPDTYVPNERFYEVLQRYKRMRGWTDGS